MDGPTARPAEGSPPGLDVLYDHLASTYPESFTNISVRGPETVVVSRVPDRGLPEGILRVRFADVRLRFADSVLSRTDAAMLMAQITNDMAPRQMEGVAIRSVAMRRDGRVEVGVDGPVDEARDVLSKRYGPHVVIVRDEGVVAP